MAVTVLVLQTFTVERSAARGGTDQKAARLGIARRPGQIADALDRVRLSDLKVRMLRHPEARAMVPFAQRLYDETTRTLRPGANSVSQWATMP